MAGRHVQHGAPQHGPGTAQHGTARHGTAQHSTAQHSMPSLPHPSPATPYLLEALQDAGLATAALSKGLQVGIPRQRPGVTLDTTQRSLWLGRDKRRRRVRRERAAGNTAGVHGFLLITLIHNKRLGSCTSQSSMCLLTSLEGPAPAAVASAGADATLCSSRATPRSTAPLKPFGGMAGWAPAAACCSSVAACLAACGPGLWLVDSDITGPWGVLFGAPTGASAGCSREGWAPSIGTLCDTRMPGCSTGASCCCRCGEAAGSVGLKGLAA